MKFSIIKPVVAGVSEKQEKYAKDLYEAEVNKEYPAIEMYLLNEKIEAKDLIDTLKGELRGLRGGTRPKQFKRAINADKLNAMYDVLMDILPSTGGYGTRALGKFLQNAKHYEDDDDYAKYNALEKYIGKVYHYLEYDAGALPDKLEVMAKVANILDLKQT